MTDDSPTHEHHMRRCIELARMALPAGDVPVGALVVLDGQVAGEGVEGVRARRDVTAHAEIEALRAACGHLQSLDLTGCTLYTSVEPCTMCAYAIRLARVGTVVSGARPPGATRALDGHTVLTDADAVPGRPLPLVIRDVMAPECLAVLAERQT